MSEEGICVSVNAKLKAACPNVQLKEVPSINQKRMVAFINNFNIQMSEYLCKFAQNAMEKLYVCDYRIGKIEDELALLEAKLQSIPIAVTGENDVTLPKSTSEISVEQKNALANISEPAEEDGLPKVEPPKESNETEVTNSSEPAKSNPEIARFLKMVQVGVPVEAVRLKMSSEGFDPSLI